MTEPERDIIDVFLARNSVICTGYLRTPFRNEMFYMDGVIDAVAVVRELFKRLPPQNCKNGRLNIRLQSSSDVFPGLNYPSDLNGELEPAEFEAIIAEIKKVRSDIKFV